MSVSINQLQAFAAVARLGSFAEASELIHLSQPALSIAIKNLESSLGGKLFDRTTRSVALTPEGKAFYPVVKRLLSDWDQSLEDVRNHFTLRKGKLDIAAMPTFTNSMLPRALADFHDQYPEIHIGIHDVTAEYVVDLVREGRCELGITFNPGDTPDLNFYPLFRDRFMAILPKDHPLLKKSQLRWKDLQHYAYIALQRPASTRHLIDKALAEKKLALTPAFEAHQLVSIGRMVSAGLGVSVVPTMSTAQMQEMGLECRPIAYPVITHEVGLISRHHHALSVSAQIMSEVIAQHCKK